MKKMKITSFVLVAIVFSALVFQSFTSHAAKDPWSQKQLMKWEKSHRNDDTPKHNCGKGQHNHQAIASNYEEYNQAN